MAVVLLESVAATNAEEALEWRTATTNQMKQPEVITQQLPSSVSGYDRPFHNMWFDCPPTVTLQSFKQNASMTASRYHCNRSHCFQCKYDSSPAAREGNTHWHQGERGTNVHGYLPLSWVGDCYTCVTMATAGGTSRETIALTLWKHHGIFENSTVKPRCCFKDDVSQFQSFCCKGMNIQLGP